MHTSLMVVDAESLTRRTTNDAINFARPHSGCAEKVIGMQVLDGLEKERHRWVIYPEGGSAMRIEVVCGQYMEPSEPKTLRKATGPGEEVNTVCALPTPPKGLQPLDMVVFGHGRYSLKRFNAAVTGRPTVPPFLGDLLS